jgi:hypothetical protein
MAGILVDVFRAVNVATRRVRRSMSLPIGIGAGWFDTAARAGA